MVERGADGSRRVAGGPREEIEWQFDAPDPGAVERWLATRGSGSPDGFDVSAPRLRRLTDRYLDTDDGLLRQAGYGLRERRSLADGAQALEATLKSLGAGGAHPVRRAEFSEPLATEGDADAPAAGAPRLRLAGGPVGARLHAVAGERPLRVLLRVDTERTTRVLRSGGAELAEIAVDRCTLAAPRAPRRRLDRVEVELTGGSDPEAVRGFVDALAEACSLTPAQASKLEAGLARPGGETGGSPAARRWPPVLRRRAPMSEAAGAALRAPLAALAAAEPVARAGSDPEGVHRMRVATRRLQAALSLYAPVLGTGSGVLRGELRWLRRALGDVRDLDTHLERIERYRAAAGPRDRAALAPLGELLTRRRDEARLESMLPALDGERYTALLAGVASLAAGRGAEAVPGAADRASAALRPAIRSSGRAFARSLRLARREDGPDQRHRARIRAKRLRYALECSGSLYGRPGRRAIKALRPLQELLGAERDALLAAAALSSIAEEPGAAGLPEATLRAMSERSAIERRRARELSGELPRASARAERRWRRLRRKRLRARERG